MSDEQDTTASGATPDPRRRARDLLRRTAPVLRDVNAAIDQNDALRETRDALVDKASELAKKADEALNRMTAIEGTVVEKRDDSPPNTTESTRIRPPSTAAAFTTSQPHWTRERVARIATAAATEAVRPHRPLLDRQTRLRLAGAGLVGLVAWAFVRTRRR